VPLGNGLAAAPQWLPAASPETERAGIKTINK